jgi:hypothetical protein
LAFVEYGSSQKPNNARAGNVGYKDKYLGVGNIIFNTRRVHIHLSEIDCYGREWSIRLLADVTADSIGGQKGILYKKQRK